LAKKPAAKKPAAKKPAAKKPAAKKPAAKKPAAKKPAAKKPAAKKPAAKKPAAKKPAAKKPAAKKPAAKKPAAKKPAAKKPAAKKPAAKKPAAKKLERKRKFDKSFLVKQKELLIKERASYLGSAETLEAEADQLLEYRDPGDVQFDEESGRGDTLAVERDLDLALSAQARDAVDEIDAALERILKNGTYGVCMTSGEDIPKARLEAIPWASEKS